MTIQQASLFGNILGLLLRTFFPFMLEVSKGKKKWSDWDWSYTIPAIWGIFPAAVTTYGVPEWLTTYGVSPESQAFVPLVFLGCMAGGYLGQDAIREFMRPKKQVETPDNPDAPTPGAGG